eukprot:6172911-Pleurochrysis_carterae.AAC.5
MPLHIFAILSHKETGRVPTIADTGSRNESERARTGKGGDKARKEGKWVARSEAVRRIRGVPILQRESLQPARERKTRVVISVPEQGYTRPVRSACRRGPVETPCCGRAPALKTRRRAPSQRRPIGRLVFQAHSAPPVGARHRRLPLVRALQKGHLRGQQAARVASCSGREWGGKRGRKTESWTEHARCARCEGRLRMHDVTASMLADGRLIHRLHVQRRHHQLCKPLPRRAEIDGHCDNSSG